MVDHTYHARLLNFLCLKKGWTWCRSCQDGCWVNVLTWILLPFSLSGYTYCGRTQIIGVDGKRKMEIRVEAGYLFIVPRVLILKSSSLHQTKKTMRISSHLLQSFFSFN
ncbi:hypothetical protein C5167_044197 [Papaver somniferum]|uniref:Uncharacterized protein n=1 Tax=Papaver somniferum TaxID=3469 RepID=A0A4Y7L8S4_PAPSO|nr:hypothetical protein C5167_044197 [Papaver somniferum]